MRGVTRRGRSQTGSMAFQLTRLLRGVTLPLIVNGVDRRTFQLTRLMRGVTCSAAPAPAQS